MEATLLVAEHTKILREVLVFTVAWSLYVLKTVKLQLRFAKKCYHVADIAIKCTGGWLLT